MNPNTFSLAHMPPRYVLASILCSIGGFLFGIDTGSIGPVTVMETFTKEFGSLSPTVHGLVVSSILIPAAITSFLAGRVADALGRSSAIATGSAIYALGGAIEAASVHIGMFVTGRVIAGIGEGLYLGTLVVYICEVSPARHRGALTTGPQLLITFGLMIGFLTCFGTSTLNSSLSWRLPYVLLSAYSAAFAAAATFLLPPSPRWLAAHGKSSAEVAEAWEKLGVLAVDREDLLDEYASETTRRYSFLELFSTEARPRFLLAVFLMGMQQLSGIDGVLYYAPLLFQQAGISSSSSTFLASGISAIVIFVVTIPATIFADSWGRRHNTIYGGLGMAATMIVIGSLYAADVVHPYGAGRWVVIIAIYLFAVTFSVTWAVGMKIYAAEIQPQRTRATATSIAHGSNWLTNYLVALITPTLLANTSFGAYFLFGGCTLATALVCWFFMPETRGKTLSEIQAGFRGSGMDRMRNAAQAIRNRFVAGPRVSGALELS